MRNVRIAVVIAGVVAICVPAASFAGATTAAMANAATAKIYTGGSPAVLDGFTKLAGFAICSGVGDVTVFTSNPPGSPVGTPDFRAISCVAAAPGVDGQQLTIYYRVEGGSAVGVYAPMNNLSVNELDLGTAGCGAPILQTDGSFQSTCTVGGTSPKNGPTDSFPTGVSKQVMEYGFSDLEPGVFGNAFGDPWAGGGNNDPTGVYPFLGTDHTSDELQTMLHNLVFQQTFGLIANKALGVRDLPYNVAAAIFAGTLTNWQDVSINGAPVKTTSTPIHVCHRDVGSGPRASVDIFFEQTGCNTGGSINALVDNTTDPDSFSDGDVLACVNGDPAAIGYVSVDNFSKVGANTTAVTLNGQKASNKASAQGDYEWAFEASVNKNSNLPFNVSHNQFWNYFLSTLEALATAPQSAQVSVLPNVNGNKPNNHTNGTLQANGTIFVTSYARATTGFGNSCSVRGNIR